MHYACSVWMAGALRCIMLVVIKWLRCSNALYLQCSNCWDAQMHYNCNVWMVETSKSSQRFAKSPRAPNYLCARDIHCTAIIRRNGDYICKKNPCGPTELCAGDIYFVEIIAPTGVMMLIVPYLRWLNGWDVEQGHNGLQHLCVLQHICALAISLSLIHIWRCRRRG